MQGVGVLPPMQMWFLQVEPTGQPESATQIRPQTPFTHSSSERHCAAVVQLGEATTQDPWLQRRPAPHEASLVQASRHRPARHRFVDGQSASDAQRPATHWESMHCSEGAQSEKDVQEEGGGPSTQR